MQIIECIFGFNIHLEIVQRSTDVLVFMAQARVLTIDDVELIWSAAGGNQHRSIVNGVYQVLAELCSKLPHEFLRNLFNKLQSVPLGSWDQQLLDLARSLFHAMVQRSKYSPEEGPISLIPYETLLNVLRNSTPSLNARDDPSFGATPPSNRDIISGIAQLLKEGLGFGPLPQDLPKLIDCCMKDLKANHPGAIWSLQAVQYIFAFASLSTHHLLQEYWRSVQLRVRFDFLKTMAKLFPVYWNSSSLAETLWSCLIVDPISVQEQDETFQCLEAMTEANFVQYIYEKLMDGLNIATITQKAWQCVRQYFLLLNWQRRNIVVTEDTSMEGAQVIVVLMPLYGMELIWKIALHAQLPIVGSHAIDLLSTLIKKQLTQQEGGTPDEAYSFREGLVETCVEHLVKSSDSLSNDDAMDMPDVSLVFERCIGILKAFLVTCNTERGESSKRPEMHGTLDEDAILTIKVTTTIPMFHLSIHPAVTLGSLRKAIASKLGCSEPEDIRLFSLGKDFLSAWDNRTLEELQVENFQPFLASKRLHSAAPSRPIEVADSSQQLWVKRFLQLGGQQRLISLLMSESGLGATDSTPTARKALSLILKVLVRLIGSSGIDSNVINESNGLTVPAFLDKLVSEILTSATREGDRSSNDQVIVLNATSLISYLCAGPLGWQYFHAGPDIRALIFVSMVQSDSMQIRQTVLEMGRKFCLQIRDVEASEISPVMFFLDIIQSFLPIAKEYESNCSELFEFFEIISREAIHYCSEEYYKALYTRIMETIINHPSYEDMSLVKEDTVLIGMLKVAATMINTDQRLKQLDTGFRIIDYVFDECLFPQTPDDQDSDKPSATCGAKCKSEGSRSAAFNFLQESARNEPEILRHIILKTHKHFDRECEMEDQWGYDPQTIKRANCGFVGLQNLGATCYVNSITQQFFMNKEFRAGILDAPVSDDDPGKHDTLLYQLQALFGNLQESIRRSYNARGFCYAYKDWDGNPMNVAIQMDVDEFFNILFDRLENSVKNTPQEELFKQQYGGKLVQQIKSKDCEHISEREDSFFSIQCEVKNKKTLEESLQLYVQGEILDGDNKYKCSSCDKHVDAIKRACIKELPQNLILHLKRFDYDMDTMRRIKINDRFEFPTSLDMEPYTLDYLTRKEQAQEAAAASPSSHLVGGQENTAKFQYKLVGVLVHTGTADSGHYYSYIKDRNAKATTENTSRLSNGDNSNWYLFNDSKVEEFDASEIPNKAFGGPEYIPPDSSPYMKSPPRSITKPYSAYMLFYERVERTSPTPGSFALGLVPSDIGEFVAKENTALMRDLAVFDRLYYRFVWDLFNLFRTIPPQIKAIEDSSHELGSLDYLSMQYGVDFFFSVLIHARDVDQDLQQWTRFLSTLLIQYPKGCANFLRSLTTDRTLLSRVLLHCPITQVREAVIDLIFEALSGLREQDKAEYGLVAAITSEAPNSPQELDDSELWICSQGSPIHGLIRALLQLLPEARINWRNFDEYFKLIYNISQLGRPERVMMVREGYVAELVELYISDERGDSKKKKMGDKFTKPTFRYLLLTVQEVLSTCDVSRSYEVFQRRGKENGGTHSSVAGRGYRKPSSPTSSASSAASSPNSDDAALEASIQISSISPEIEQSVLLSHADFNALFACYPSPVPSEKSQSLILMSKMIQDGIDSVIIARLVLEQPPQPSIAYECLDFFRTISDYGQCGRFAQSWLLRNSRVWLQELLLNQSDSDTRLRARLFYMELLSSERAFNGWSDEQAANASAHHFHRLLELMNIIPEMLSYYPTHLRKDEENGGFRFVDYFKSLTELIKSDTERQMFYPYWKVFIDIVSKIDSYQLAMDHDKREMMFFWDKIMIDNQDANTRLANFKPLGLLLRKFFVCLQSSPANAIFHREILPIYFGLVLRFCKLSQSFHLEWAQCHNYTWAIGAMKWGGFTQHCPEELSQLLQFTLSELPQYRQECWRALPSSDTPRFFSKFLQLARDTFEPENELAGVLFYQCRGLVHLTDAMSAVDNSGMVTNDEDFFAVEALTLLYDYLCEMVVCRSTPGNLMWTTPPHVYARSIKILEVIAKEATYSQAEPILFTLDKAHLELRDTLESGNMSQSQVQTIFGGRNSTFCRFGALESRTALSNIGSPPMRIGPVIFMNPELFKGLGKEAAQYILKTQFMPYWELARSACNLDGGKDRLNKAIELSSLMTMEQISVGSTIHLEVLCKEALEAADDEDAMLLFQNPYVALCIEHVMKREVYIGSLTRSHLNSCAVLVKLAGLEESQLSIIIEENFGNAEKVAEKLSEIEDVSSTILEDDAQALVTSMQNLVILEVDGDNSSEAIKTRLRRLQERLEQSQIIIPTQYREVLSGLFPQLSEMSTLGSVKIGLPKEMEEPVHIDDTKPSADREDEAELMTGVISEATSSINIESTKDNSST
ncbi:hypothetical protein BGZ76_007601 [Entomortierella beljakovae]|nr:hypothetical protein BGZ76_007601 [Entomortierella beljakovae]